MYFSIIAVLIIVLLLCFLGYKKYSWKTYIGYLEPYESSVGSYRVGEFTRKKFFYYKGGMIDLKKHPEYRRFHVTGGKDVLVRVWDRDKELVLDEGKTKVAIFEVTEDLGGVLIAIPCLRTVESIIVDENNNPLEGYKTTSLGVSWGSGEHHKVLPSENLIGTVEYESL